MVMKMDKVLVKVYVPMLEENYDVWIPLNKKIYEVIGLLVNAISDLNNQIYYPTKIPNLYDKLTGEEYNVNVILKDTNIRNGTEVILI